jgi:hypothetical protein
VVKFLETCPATLSWEGTFYEEGRIDLAVHADGDDCSGEYTALFDLRPPRSALVGLDPKALGLLFIRIPGVDADRGPDCALYKFFPNQPTRPGSGWRMECP